MDTIYIMAVIQAFFIKSKQYFKKKRLIGIMVISIDIKEEKICKGNGINIILKKFLQVFPMMRSQYMYFCKKVLNTTKKRKRFILWAKKYLSRIYICKQEKWQVICNHLVCRKVTGLPSCFPTVRKQLLVITAH